MNAEISIKKNSRDLVDSYLGITIAMGAFSMFFGSLFVAYFVLRFRQPQWPPPEFPPFPKMLPLLNTLVLFFSSIFFHMGLKKLEASSNNGFKLFLGLTLLSAFAFLGLQWLLWQNMALLGIHVGSGPFGSIFYGFTFLHAIHLIVGILALLWLVPGALFGTYLDRTVRVRMVGIVWHFLDLTWIVLYFAIFVL